MGYRQVAGAALTVLLVSAAPPPAGAEPADDLVLLPVNRFVKVWDDSGSGADADASVWRPDTAAYPGYHSLGDIAMAGHKPPATAFLVRAADGVLARPAGYRKVWDDRGSGGDTDVTFWEPVAPPGFSCLGTIASPRYDRPPPTDAVRCLKSTYTAQAVPRKVWDDSGSGARDDVGVWEAEPQDHRGFPPSTFVARRSHGDPGPAARYRAVDKARIAVPALSGAPVTVATAARFAPRVWVHPEETYYPSPVEFFLANVRESGGHLVTKEPLGCPSCTGPEFLDGQRPDRARVNAYAQVVRRTDDGRPTTVTDVIYWMFYPYNEGKRVCVGVVAPGGGCVGVRQSFGNHVGDWEHITIRFVDDLPSKVFYSAHSGGREYTYGDKAVPLADWRPTVYSARGSHGSYPAAGTHTYRELPNGDALTDRTAAGLLWDTSSALVAFSWQPKGTYTGALAWLNIAQRWGNPKAGCELSEPVSGECVRNGGPDGPMYRDYAQPPLSPLE